MPKISDDEYKKFQELLKKEQQREKGKEISREIYLEKLKQNAEKMINITSTYGEIGAQALTFTQWLENQSKVNNTDVFYFSWTEMLKYFGAGQGFNLKPVYKIKEDGEYTLKRSFRNQMKRRGWTMRINRENNTLKVERI